MPFTLALRDEKAFLSASGLVALGMRLDGLELEVPPLGAPPGPEDPPARFQRRRCRLAAARVSIDEAALERLVVARGAALGAAGLDESHLRLLDGTVEISGRVRAGDRSAAITARARLEAGGGRGLRVTITDVHVFGFLARPTALVTHDLCAALAPGAVHGLDAIELYPLDEILHRTLPAAGYRLPDLGHSGLHSVRVERGCVELGFAAGEAAGGRRAPDALRAGDLALLGGNLDEAAAHYRAELARQGGDNQAAAVRLLGVLVGSEETLAEAEQTAREALSRWPDLVPAHLALAAVTAERGRAEQAAAEYARVAELAGEAANDEDAVRAALAAARLLRPVDAAAATRFYGRVLERRPDHAEAADALLERYRAEERWPDLLRLSRRRLAVITSPPLKAREHLRAGELLLGPLGEPREALHEIELASRLAEDDPKVWTALSRARAACGDDAGSLAALDRLAELHASKGDALGEATVLASAAAAVEQSGDAAGALERWRRVAALSPDDERALRGMAIAAARAGARDEAREALDRLMSPPHDRRWAILQRARLELEAGDPALARAWLERAGDGDARSEGDRQELLAQAAAAGDAQAGDLHRASQRREAERLAREGDAAGAARAYRGLAGEAAGAAVVELHAAAALAFITAGEPGPALETARAGLESGAGLAEGELAALRQLAGEAAWQLRAWPEIAAAYQPLFADHPGASVEAARRLGMALERTGRGAEALPVYRAAIDDANATGEPLAAVWRRLADLLESMGLFAEASEALHRSAADARTGAGPQARAEERRRAAEIFRRRLADPERAVHELEEALRLLPDHMPSLDALESIAGEGGNHERVAQILGRKVAATARQPERQKALLARLADVQRSLGRPEAALEAYRRALELDAGFGPALAGIAAVTAAPPRPEPGEAPAKPAAPRAPRDLARALADRLAAAGLDDRAQEILGDLRRAAHAEGQFEPLADGLDAVALALGDEDERAAAFFAEEASIRRSTVGDLAGAVHALARAVTVRPDDGALSAELASLLFDGGGRAPLPEGFRAPPKLWVRLGELELAAGRFADAVEHLRRAEDMLEAGRPAGAPHDPLRTRLHASLDAALRGAGRYDEAAQLLLLRARGDTSPAERLALLREVAELLDGPAGQPDEATDVYAEIARLDPRDRRARVRAGSRASAEAVRERERIRLADAEDWPGLLEVLDAQAHELPDERCSLLTEAATVAADRLGNVDGALVRLSAALDAAPDDPARAGVLARRAELYARLGRGEHARADVDQALAVGPPAPILYLALGRLHLAEGHHEVALRHLGAALAGRLDPHLTTEAHLLSGHVLETMGRPDGAIVHYEQASTADPYDPRPLDALTSIGEAKGDVDLIAEILGRRILICASHHERARLWLKRARLYREAGGRELEAYRCFKEAYANDPEHLEAVQALRELAVARGEHALCAELYYREIQAAGDAQQRAALHVALAELYERELGDADAALRNYESALLDDGARSDAAISLARLYEQAGRFDDAGHAEELAAVAEAEHEARAGRLLRAGELRERAGRLDEALRLYTAAAAIEGAPAAGEAKRRADAVVARAVGPGAARAELAARLQASDDPAERLDLLRQLTQLAVIAGDAADIDARSRELLLSDPADAGAFSARRSLLSARGDWAGLADLLRLRAEVSGDVYERADLYFELGRIAGQRLGDPGRAALAYEQALALAPDHAPTLDALADMVYRQHDWERAHDLYRRLDAEGSFLGADVVKYRQGELAEVLGHEEEAEQAYQAAVALNPSHLAALEAIARLALYRDEVTAAIVALRAVLELLPLDDVDRITASRQQLGELCQRAGDTASARAYFELVLVEDPTRIAVLEPLAELYAGAGMWPKAADALSRLSYLVVAPDRRAEILFRMGEILRLQLGDEDRASDAYLKAIDLDPQHVPTMRRLVDYYFAQADDASVAEMAAELEGRGELLAAETSHETLAKVAVSAGLDSESHDPLWGNALSRALADGGAGALATVLADATAKRPGREDDIVRVARELCRSPGPELEVVKQVLAARAEKDDLAARLASLL